MYVGGNEEWSERVSERERERKGERERESGGERLESDRILACCSLARSLDLSGPRSLVKFVRLEEEEEEELARLFAPCRNHSVQLPPVGGLRGMDGGTLG